MSYTKEQAEEVANSVLGTCQLYSDSDFESWGITEDEFDKILTEEEIFLCDCCGWYCNESESNESTHYQGDKICTECWELENEE